MSVILKMALDNDDAKHNALCVTWTMNSQLLYQNCFGADVL